MAALAVDLAATPREFHASFLMRELLTGDRQRIFGMSRTFFVKAAAGPVVATHKHDFDNVGGHSDTLLPLQARPTAVSRKLGFAISRANVAGGNARQSAALNDVVAPSESGCRGCRFFPTPMRRTSRESPESVFESSSRAPLERHDPYGDHGTPHRFQLAAELADSSGSFRL